MLTSVQAPQAVTRTHFTYLYKENISLEMDYRTLTQDELKYKNAPHRFFCFTINNPTADDDKQLTDLTSDVDYLVYAEEHFDTPGETPHYQGYVEFSNPQRWSWLKKRLSRAHLEYKKGSRTQARDYCFKECMHPHEFGKWKAD